MGSQDVAGEDTLSLPDPGLLHLVLTGALDREEVVLSMAGRATDLANSVYNMLRLAQEELNTCQVHNKELYLVQQQLRHGNTTTTTTTTTTIRTTTTTSDVLTTTEYDNDVVYTSGGKWFWSEASSRWEWEEEAEIDSRSDDDPPSPPGGLIFGPLD